MFRVSPKTKNVLWILVIDSLLLLLIWLTDSSLDDIKKYKISLFLGKVVAVKKNYPVLLAVPKIP